MRILLDECVPQKLKGKLYPLNVYTVRDMGFNGLKNGNLISAAINASFDMLLSIDKNIRFQQNISGKPICIVILDVVNGRIDFFNPLIPKFMAQLESFEAGKVYIISEGS